MASISNKHFCQLHEQRPESYAVITAPRNRSARTQKRGTLVRPRSRASSALRRGYRRFRLPPRYLSPRHRSPPCAAPPPLTFTGARRGCVRPVVTSRPVRTHPRETSSRPFFRSRAWPASPPGRRIRHAPAGRHVCAPKGKARRVGRRCRPEGGEWRGSSRRPQPRRGKAPWWALCHVVLWRRNGKYAEFGVCLCSSPVR